MGLMMSVLVFSIGVLEALACVEHVRQSYLPLDFGRKRRRLVLDVGSGTIRHRETRRSSEFQRDPHVFLRSIQAAVEEEGDVKESEEVAAILQAVEAHNIHSTQILSHQDPVFLTVNDIDESDSCASSEISSTSTPNTVIMNVSPEFDRRSTLEPCYIPSDSIGEHSGLKSDEIFSNQKDISITHTDSGQFMCIREPEVPFDRTDIGEVYQSSSTENETKDTTICAINLKLLPNKQIEINEGNGISNVDVRVTDIVSIPVQECGEENSTESCLLTNSILTDGNDVTISSTKEGTSINDEIGTNPDSLSFTDGEKNGNINIIDKSTLNLETDSIQTVSVNNNRVSMKPCDTSVHNDDNIIQDNGLVIDHVLKENSSILTNSSIVVSNNREAIEKCGILVKSQAHGGKEPLIENKGKDIICERELEQVTEPEKQYEKDEAHRPSVIMNPVNIELDTTYYEKDAGFNSAKEIHCIDQSYSTSDFSERENFSIAPKPENGPFQEVFHTTQLKESEIVLIKLDESKDNIIESVNTGTFNNDASCIRMPSHTVSDPERKITERSNEDPEVCKLQVTHKGKFDEVDPILDVASQFNKSIDPGIVNQVKEHDERTKTDRFIEVNTCNTADSMSVCIDNNSNIVREASDPGERKTLPKNDQANQKTMPPTSNETVFMETSSASTENSLIVNSSCVKEQVDTTIQELASEDINPVDTKSSIQEDIYDVAEGSESNKIVLNEANVNAHHESESMRELSKPEGIFDDARHPANIPEDVNIKEEFCSEKGGPFIKSKIVDECVRHLTDVVSEEQTLSSKNDFNRHTDTQRPNESEEPADIKEKLKPSEQTIPKSIEVDSHEEVGSKIIVSKDKKGEAVDSDTRHPMNGAVSNENRSQVESISNNNATKNEVCKTEKLHSVALQPSKVKIKTESNEEITSKDLLDVKESLKPLPQKEPANDKGGKPSDQKAIKKDKNGVLAKQETLNVSPLADDVTVLVGDFLSQNQFTPVEDITSPDKAFWLIFSGEYTKAMSKDWHSGHFCCWQCDESLTGQRYVLRDDHPYCIKCYEQVFANTCDECSKVIGIDSKDLSYKDKHWHEACFLCSKCRVSLVDKQFGSKADKIYCGNCYDAQFASRCDGCGQIFRAGTKKMEYKTRQWHEQCFCCCVCKSAIGTKSFIPREQEIYCATCYEEKFATRCVKCNKIITSGGVTYKNEPWHRECFTCTNCSTSLAGQRFTSRDEKPYCAECFGELFAKRCTACCKPITGIGGTRFISFEDRHWHNDCFICASCRSSLVGRGFITDAEDILCTECAKQKLM